MTTSDTSAKLNGRPLDEVRDQVLAAAKKMYARGLVEGTAGNVSGRVDDGTVVVTPSSLGYDEMTLADLVQVTLDGEVVSGERSPTSEKNVHLAAYAAYPEVGGVVHCHAKYASTYAVAHEAIPAAIDEFIVYIGGDVPCCEYHPSGSAELGPEVASRLADRSAALMANHGLVAIGKSVDDALHSALVVEHNAQIFWGAKLLGGVVPLPEKDRTNFKNVYDYIREYTWMPSA
ncbi:MAG TPA: class II aldolase/adducin family protein [Acidimicrobiales bacterium]|nr:class II aldolase/adducin family protein [Acidimicrobiales bacterium]